MNENPDLFLVAEYGTEIIGFCMGYVVNGKSISNQWVKKHFLQVGVKLLSLLLKGDSVAWNKVRSMRQKKSVEYIDHSYDNISMNQKIDLLSICVCPEYRGSGLAVSLIKQYEDIILKKGRNVCVLSAKKDNARGLHFYEKLGYIPYKKNHENISFIKVLNKE